MLWKIEKILLNETFFVHGNLSVTNLLFVKSVSCFEKLRIRKSPPLFIALSTLNISPLRNSVRFLLRIKLVCSLCLFLCAKCDLRPFFSTIAENTKNVFDVFALFSMSSFNFQSLRDFDNTRK